jgi:hypothetical protein
MARRKATKQLLRVSWHRFRKAYLAYPQWEAFVLWTHAILTAEGRAPSWLLEVAKKHCPGFAENETLANEPGTLDLRLREWIHTRIFRQAREEGWLDALTFFGVRDLRSQAAWAYWVQSERKWRRKRPRPYPSFEKWWQAAQKYDLRKKVSVARIADAVEKYVEWRAFAYWLRPLLEANRKVPDQVAAELKRRCPGFVGFSNPSALKNKSEKARAWRHFVRWIADHSFAKESERGWFDMVVEQARNDPHHVRTIEFWKRSSRTLPRNPAIAYPSFSEWRRAADSYIAD